MSVLSPSPSLSRKLVERCDYPVDDASRRRASVHMLDWLGCIIAGQGTETGKSLGNYSRKFTPFAGSSFNALGTSLCALEAAFVNGGLGNLLEMDDVHRQSLLHVGDTVMPAALAVAQGVSADGAQLLDAIVKGYEVAIQIGLVAASGGYSPWYNSSTCGVFGAGMAASVLLQLNQEETLDALAQCGMMASGLWQCRLEPGASKQLATAHAARSGVSAAMLASQHFPGPKHILDGELGFFKTLYPLVSFTSLADELTGDWRINEVSLKPWPACRHTHPTIEAALTLKAAIDINDISAIEVGSYCSGLDFCDNPVPVSDHEARFSFQYCVATALLRGNPEVKHFSDSARCSRPLLSLMERTKVCEDNELEQSFPNLLGGRVTLKLNNGTSHTQTVQSARGDPENPMTIDDIQQKFSALADAAGIDYRTRKSILLLLLGSDKPLTLPALTEHLRAIENQLEEHRHAT